MTPTDAETGEDAQLPDASRMSGMHLSDDWHDVDIYDAQAAWLSFQEKMRRQMQNHQERSRKLHADAALALSQAEAQERFARECWNVLHTLQRAPITFPTDAEKRV